MGYLFLYLIVGYLLALALGQFRKEYYEVSIYTGSECLRVTGLHIASRDQAISIRDRYIDELRKRGDNRNFDSYIIPRYSLSLGLRETGREISTVFKRFKH